MIRRMASPLVLLVLLLAPAPAYAGTQQVSMAQYAFGPSTLAVHVGDSITWTNHDQAPHDVTTTSAPVAIHSPLLSTGQSFTYTFSQPGTYAYYCSIHPDMRAQIVVLPAPTTQQQAPPPAPKPVTKPTTAQQRLTQPGTAVPRSAAEPPPMTSDSMPMSATQQPAQAQAVTPTAQSTLDPMLLVAGLVAGVATLCLLVIASRPQT